MPRILLVEDDANVRTLIEHVLLHEGYEVDTTGTASGGTELVRCRSYDLVVADGKLPDGTGMEVADAATERGMRAIIITGYAFTLPIEDRDRYEVMLKPLRPGELISAIERVLQN
jgi:DNA-binding NtrC family response regulator